MDAETYRTHVDHLNNAGYTALLMSLGHELGLFDRMMQKDRPLTSSQLADSAGMKERYVREWLHGMVVGQVISYKKETGQFYIPLHHHAALKVAACWAGGIGIWAARGDDVKKCFMENGPFGLPDYQTDVHMKWFGGYRAITSKVLIANVVQRLEETHVADKLKLGVNVLDAGCGSGEITAEFVRTFPNSTFTALDVSENFLALTNKKLSQTGTSRNKILLGDIQSLPDKMSERFAVVLMFDCLHDLPDPYKAVSEVHRVLEPGGHFVVLDSRPCSRLEDEVGKLEVSMFYTASVFNCLPASLSAEPRTGGGTCWGRDNVTAAVQEKFDRHEVFDIDTLDDLHVCTKQYKVAEE